MTEPAAATAARDVRRIVLGLLLVAAAAGGVALALGLRGSGDRPAVESAAPSIFPVSFTQAGFVERTVTLGPDVVAPAATGRLTRTVDVAAAATVWVVARCDRGTIVVQLGGVESSQRCSGAPVGVTGLRLTDPRVRLQARVSAQQHQPWGVAIYR